MIIRDGTANPVQVGTIANLLMRWKDTHTASFIDDAVIFCDNEGLSILPVLAREIARAARHRRGAKLSKGEREGIKGAALNTMVNLIIRGATLREASGKAAKWINSKEPAYKIKASSLEKEYAQAYRYGDEPLEDAMREFNAENPDAAIDKAWKRIREELPEPDEDERGERR